MDQIKAVFAGRPFWMNAIMVFCAYMTFIYLPFDMFWKPIDQDQEVWFGLVLTGWAAKATEPLHWLIYGYGGYGFYRMKSWMHPWAALYVVQIAIGMFVFSELDPRGRGFVAGTVTSLPFIVLAVALWRSKTRFGGPDHAVPHDSSDGAI